MDVRLWAKVNKLSSTKGVSYFGLVLPHLGIPTWSYQGRIMNVDLEKAFDLGWGGLLQGNRAPGPLISAVHIASAKSCHLLLILFMRIEETSCVLRRCPTTTPQFSPLKTPSDIFKPSSSSCGFMRITLPRWSHALHPADTRWLCSSIRRVQGEFVNSRKRKFGLKMSLFLCFYSADGENKKFGG